MIFLYVVGESSLFAVHSVYAILCVLIFMKLTSVLFPLCNIRSLVLCEAKRECIQVEGVLNVAFVLIKCI